MRSSCLRQLSSGTDLVLSAWRTVGGAGVERLTSAVARCRAEGVAERYAPLLAQAEALLAAPVNPAALAKLDEILRQAVAGSISARASARASERASAFGGDIKQWWIE